MVTVPPPCLGRLLSSETKTYTHSYTSTCVGGCRYTGGLLHFSHFIGTWWDMHTHQHTAFPPPPTSSGFTSLMPRILLEEHTTPVHSFHSIPVFNTMLSPWVHGPVFLGQIPGHDIIHKNMHFQFHYILPNFSWKQVEEMMGVLTAVPHSGGAGLCGSPGAGELHSHAIITCSTLAASKVGQHLFMDALVVHTFLEIAIFIGFRIVWALYTQFILSLSSWCPWHINFHAPHQSMISLP